MDNSRRELRRAFLPLIIVALAMLAGGATSGRDAITPASAAVEGGK